MKFKYLGMALMVLALASCGGGGGGSSASGSTSSPTSAAATVSGNSKTFPSICYSGTSSTNPNQSASYRTFGNYNVYSNIWNPSAATAWSQCTSATIASPGGVTAAEFDWNFTSTNSDVKTYPNVQYGQQNSYNSSTTPLLPAPISALPSLTATGNITTTCTSGPCVYNTAFDVFFSSGASSSTTIQAELMIMTQYNIPGLGGFATASPVTIDGATYNIRQFTMTSGSSSWPYVAYWATSPITQVNLNINSFVADAVKRGYIPASYYLDMVEIGTEVQTGQGVTKISNYSVH